MTEETPFNPCSKKGEIRAEIAITLLNEVRAGKLNAMIARSADFYGPHVKTGVANILVFEKLAQGATASWLVNDSVRHSYTYTLDAAKSLAMLADTESAWNQTWHVPTARNPPTGKEFIEGWRKYLKLSRSTEFCAARSSRLLACLTRISGSPTKCFIRAIRNISLTRPSSRRLSVSNLLLTPRESGGPH
jgi:nucleoside-diphosphate-sugar epimerase